MFLKISWLLRRLIGLHQRFQSRWGCRIPNSSRYHHRLHNGSIGGGGIYIFLGSATVECVVLYGVPNLRYSIKGASMGRLLLPPGREWNPRQHGSDAIGSPEFESFKNSI